MATRKKTTVAAKPQTKRARKKVDRDLEGGLFGNDVQADSPEPDSGASLQGSDKEVTQISDVVAAEPELVAPSAEGHESSRSSREQMTPGQEQRKKTAQSWMLVTSHLNLLYMLAAGMVMGPAGFSGKYYRDPSSDFSGLIPVFRGGIPEMAIEQAISEQRHLRPCVVELDLDGISGLVHLIARNGDVSTKTLPSDMGSEVGALLLPSPLPMALVRRLLFRSAADRKEFEASSRSFANVDLSDLRIEISERFFGSAKPMHWPLPEQPNFTAQGFVDQPPAHGAAVGGALAMLYHVANRSDLCCSVYRMASGAGVATDDDVVRRDPVLAELTSWIESCAPRPEGSIQAQLFWGAVRTLVDAQVRGLPEKPVDLVLGFLDSQVSGLQEAGYRSRLERLITDMRATFGLGGGTISQLFERHKGTLSRPLLLFCLRERCVDLLEFSHPDLSDEELALAAVLFGVRDGWIGLPVELRSSRELSRFVEHRMFDIECSMRGARLSLDSGPSRPTPLRELLKASEGPWSGERSASLAKLVNRLGWHDCLTSRIRLPHGQYRLNISADGAEVIVRGHIRPPTVEIDKGGLLKKISQWPPLRPDIEDEIRASLDSRV